MAKALSNFLFKGLAGLPATRTSRIVPGFCYQSGMAYATTVPDDPDTHEDFKPTNKLENSVLSLRDVVEQDVQQNPVMIYMKGVPDVPQCGFSALAVKVLKLYDVPLSARSILEDAELKNAVKSFSNWPTFPQIFIKGEFIGGSDIILSMHQSGELKEKLKDIANNQKTE
ncbi:monothiol glutaredoxin-S15, mitochondrial-like isoform X2 [Cucurbita pepo subsp. pepo]|uniref:monothiol glutaredoxin-S15, mitochondrial-like isoform X2 n=1 Tax=Cucurbita pepo subsp. pepo TaxID=3664 RepID=UPI000C9D44F7|nr:monothiol glutaredoxin-S15, mitochondrial-like isoform X2 [Cucurbita pepo subsp. pepo]XP_023524824.1 monothiol glutaredoxin-S15, mitochondrial-like isoform X2 [Cucurbita pepo subsp. pepo]XP_023524825.1 monothiol glutaredoxin-S15, mitochondrial-like isoform X2 [Cucurbita pepo subsp. pepo]